MGDPCGPLHGVPVSIKDVPTLPGSGPPPVRPFSSGTCRCVDAAVVARLKQAGAIVLGKTNTPEFAAGANTVTGCSGHPQPVGQELTVGGSTGGGAASVAACMVRLAEGTDFGGSLRIPAAFCGVVGLRPTAGLVPGRTRAALVGFRPDPRPHRRAARADCALMLDAMVGIAMPRRSPLPHRGRTRLAGERRTRPPGPAGGHVADIRRHRMRSRDREGLSRPRRGPRGGRSDRRRGALDLSEGRRPTWIARPVDGRAASRVRLLPRSVGLNLAGNIREGMKLTVLD